MILFDERIHQVDCVEHPYSFQTRSLAANSGSDLWQAEVRRYLSLRIFSLLGCQLGPFYYCPRTLSVPGWESDRHLTHMQSLANR
jgi:hypothetical protein